MIMNYIFLLFVLALFSCSSPKIEPAIFCFPAGKIELSNYKPNFDTFILQTDTVGFSYDGWISVCNDRIVSVDKYLVNIHAYSLNGTYQECVLRRGRSLSECPAQRLNGFGIDDNNRLILADDVQYFVYDTTHRLETRIHFQFNRHSKPNLDGNNLDKYRWTDKRNCIRLKDSALYTIAKWGGHSSVKEQNLFYNMANNIMKFNLKNKKPELVFARYPKIYQDSKNLFPFSYTSFDIDKEGNFYVSFEADSLIYKYDNKLKQVATYGFSGCNMNLDYAEYRYVETVRDFMKKERKSKGYYEWIEYIDSHRLLLRLYRRGDKDKNDGLQFYNENTLIADVAIPKGYSYAGYSNNELYLYNIDIMNEQVKIIKTKLPSL